MLKNQCISVTDLRLNTKKCLENLKKHEKIVFVNNKPVAALIDIGEYEQYLSFKGMQYNSYENMKTTQSQLGNSHITTSTNYGNTSHTTKNHIKYN